MTGMEVRVTVNDAYKEAVDEENIWVDYKNILTVLQIGKTMYIDDGLLSLVVIEKGESDCPTPPTPTPALSPPPPTTASSRSSS